MKKIIKLKKLIQLFLHDDLYCKYILLCIVCIWHFASSKMPNLLPAVAIVAVLDVEVMVEVVLTTIKIPQVTS